MVEVEIEGEKFSRNVADNPNWKAELALAIGVKTLDLNSTHTAKDENSSNVEIVLVTPKAGRDVIERGFEYPYGATISTIRPPSGAMMWSLRDFRTE